MAAECSRRAETAAAAQWRALAAELARRAETPPLRAEETQPPPPERPASEPEVAPERRVEGKAESEPECRQESSPEYKPEALAVLEGVSGQEAQSSTARKASTVESVDAPGDSVRDGAQRRPSFTVQEDATDVERASHVRLTQLGRATEVVRGALERRYAWRQLRLYVERETRSFLRERIRGLTLAVTEQLWRENFSAAMREIVYRRRRCAAPRAEPNCAKTEADPCGQWRWYAPYWVLLAQFLLSLFLLCFLAGTARPHYAPVLRIVDATVSFLLLSLLPLLPLSPWRVLDGALSVVSFACACAGYRPGVCAATLFTLNIPFLVQSFLPAHAGTRTYCRAVERAARHLVLLSPLGAAGIGAALRAAVRADALLPRARDAGAALIALWGTAAPQWRVDRVAAAGGANVSHTIASTTAAVGIPAALRTHSTRYADDAGNVLVRERVPIAPVVLAIVALRLWTWAAVFIGAHNAVRKHYEASDEARLRRETSWQRAPHRQEEFEAQLAKDMRALRRHVDGRYWRPDVRAAKEAIEASHYDYKASNTIHRFVRKVQDGIVAGNIDIGYLSRNGASFFAAPITAEWGKWDCRNEDPKLRFKYDVYIIRKALGLRERLTCAERLVRRQWLGAITRRETTPILLACVILAAAIPNYYPVESSLSTFFAIELLLSFRYTRIEFIFRHALKLLIRVFSVVVGYVPKAIPFAILRSLRLLEGWSILFPIDSMVLYVFLYLIITFFTMWMIGFVAMWQFHFETPQSLCHDLGGCLVLSLREMVLPAWTYTHMDLEAKAPLMYAMIVLFQLLFVPLAAALLMHPLLQLSGFVAHFIRLVIQSLRHDVTEYIDSYIEGPVWFSHWRLRCGLPASIVTKLRMWVYDIRRSTRADRNSRGHARRSGILSLSSSLRGLNQSYTAPTTSGIGNCLELSVEGRNEDLNATKNSRSAYYLGSLHVRGKAAREESIFSRAQFASFAENDAYRNPYVARHRALARVLLALRWPPLHYVNLLLTLLSIAFLWVVDATSRLPEPTAVASLVVHAISAAFSLLLVPRDASALLTFVALIALTAALSLQYGSNKHQEFFSLRFLSLLRLGQIQVFFFTRVRGLARLMILSWISVLFPLIAAGGVLYVVELMRAQVLLVRLDARGVPVAHPDARALFARHFREDAAVLHAVLCQWLLPACCAAAALALLRGRGAGASLPDPQAFALRAARLLEDPAAAAHVRDGGGARWLRRGGHAALLASLLLALLLGPAAADAHRLFFAAEAAFAAVGVAGGTWRLHVARRRTAFAWEASRAAARGRDAPAKPMANTALLLAEAAQLLYWACALPLALTLLAERSAALIAPESYALFVVPARFALLLQLLPHRYLLSFVRRAHMLLSAAACAALYIVGAASILADVHVAATAGQTMSGALWRSAAEDLLRQIFTTPAPVRSEGTWAPDDAAARLREMINANETISVVTDAYAAAPLLIALAILGKVVLASLFGLLIASMLFPLRFLIFDTLPRGAEFLYRTLRGGLDRVVDTGARMHDDMRPEDRRRAQRHKFANMFGPRGIPFWLVPHLLEELGMCKPGQQRRFLFALEQLLVFLPIAEARARCVAEYAGAWDCYDSGGPARLSFAALPVYPPSNAAPAAARFVSPLRLVQAMALFESGFPPHSSIGSKIWLEFFMSSQLVRGATLLQSLWRMYLAVKAFEEDRSRSALDIAMARVLRRAFRRNRMLSCAKFFSHRSFEEAVRCQPDIFNHGTGHYDVLRRLRGRYGALQPTRRLQLRQSLAPLRACREGVSPTTIKHNPLSQPHPPPSVQNNRRMTASEVQDQLEVKHGDLGV